MRHHTTASRKSARQWALGALLAATASTSMAALERLEPTVWLTGVQPVAMQDDARASTLTLASGFWALSLKSYGEDARPVYSSSGITRAVSMLNTYSLVDQADSAVYEIGSSGGVTFTSGLSVDGVPVGGPITVSDMRINFGSKTIVATLIGGNGLGTLHDVPVWTVDTLSSEVLACGQNNGGMCDALWAPAGAGQPEHRLNTVATGLHLTQGGAQAFAQVLGSQPWLRTDSGVDFGTFTTSTMFISGPELHAVPEPGTSLMTGVGLIGLAGVAARRRIRK